MVGGDKEKSSEVAMGTYSNGRGLDKVANKIIERKVFRERRIHVDLDFLCLGPVKKKEYVIRSGKGKKKGGGRRAQSEGSAEVLRRKRTETQMKKTRDNLPRHISFSRGEKKSGRTALPARATKFWVRKMQEKGACFHNRESLPVSSPQQQ